MKRGLLFLALMGTLTLLLSACVVSINGGGGNLPPGVTITNARYETDWEATVNGQLQDVICNDRTTNLTYSFRFSGNLETWTSFLEGATTGREVGRVTLNLNSPNVVWDRTTNTVTVNYRILANAAPLAIVPQPRILGYTQLFLNVNDFTRDYELFSNDIPVLATCG